MDVEFGSLNLAAVGKRIHAWRSLALYRIPQYFHFVLMTSRAKHRK